MKIENKMVVVTGGGSGIGAATARRMAEMGARVCVADLDQSAAQGVAGAFGGLAVQCDVTDEEAIKALVAECADTLGPIDIFVSNAGLGKGQPDHAASASNDVWDLNWKIHVMSHVFAARALLPEMLARGHGHFVNVSSAAGLLNQIGDSAYSATKHAAVSFAESLNIMHADEGIEVSVVCPQYVATPLIGLSDGDADRHENLLSADDVAKAITDGVEAGTFRILPHPVVAGYTALRGQDPDRWLEGMRKLKAVADAKIGRADLKEFYKLV